MIDEDKDAFRTVLDNPFLLQEPKCQPVVMVDGGVYVPNSGDVEVTVHDGSKTIIRVDGPTMLPIKALEAKMLPDFTPRTKVGHLGRCTDVHVDRELTEIAIAYANAARYVPDCGNHYDPSSFSKPKNCSECRGTGWYTGLIERSPCSQGCKPK